MSYWTSLGMDASDAKINWFKGTLYDLARAQVSGRRRFCSLD